MRVRYRMRKYVSVTRALSAIRLTAHRCKLFSACIYCGVSILKLWKPTLVLIAVAVLGVILWGVYMRYFIVTNPDEPGFDPKQFRFSNYTRARGNEHDVRKALAKMFPLGTDKVYVDDILMKRAGAWIGNNENTEYHQRGDEDYTYVWSPSGMGGWTVRFIYDEDKKTKMMKMGKRSIYGVDPKDKFWEEKGHGGK